MTAHDAHEPDDIDVLLDGTAIESPVDEKLRGELLRLTGQTIRRRKNVRRAGLLGLVAGAYLAGVLTMNWRIPQQDITLAGRADLASAEAPLTSDHDAPAAAPAYDEMAYPIGELADLNRYEVFCRAAERHLNETGNYTAALNLYRQALNAASEDQLAIAAGRDTWLLMALKNARQQERNDAIPEI